MQGGVVFRVGGESFFLPATVAVRVVPAPVVGRVPGAPPELLGLSLVEGEMIPVIAVGDARTAMLVVSYLGERVGIVGVEVVATGRFETYGDHVVHDGVHARLFDVSAAIARVAETRWAV